MTYRRLQAGLYINQNLSQENIINLKYNDDVRREKEKKQNWFTYRDRNSNRNYFVQSSI